MTTNTTYRWSPEVERRFLALVSVGCGASIIAEQIGCSERMARRLVMRWKAGLALNMEPPRAALSELPAPPRRKPGRPGASWATNIMNASPEERDEKRRKVLARLHLGESLERVSAGTKVPISVIREWVAEEGVDDSIEDDLSTPHAFVPWPKVDRDHDEWPADLRFEDDPRACRPEPFWVPVRGVSDRMSYCSNATAWAAL